MLTDIINAHCKMKTGKLPNIKHPISFTDKMQWLKLYDQMPEHIVCVDKYVARSYISSIVGKKYLLEVYGAERELDSLDINAFPKPFVLKLNNDHGSVRIINNNLDFIKYRRSFLRKSQINYGSHKGEWAYSHVKPIFFAEEYMGEDVIDYKFNCCHGDISWVRVVRGRNKVTPIETVTDKDYNPLDFYFTPNITHSTTPPQKPVCWEEMKDIACKVAEKFRFVSVDLYDYNGMPKFGELTFWPLAGVLPTKYDNKFGELLTIDLSYKRPMLHYNISHKSPQKSFLKKKLHRFGVKLKWL